MGDTETPPPTNDEPTPEEKKKYSKWFAEMLAEQGESPPAPARTPAPAPQSQGLADAVNAVLDQREKQSEHKAQHEAYEQRIKELEAKQSLPKKVRGWFSPLFD